MSGSEPRIEDYGLIGDCHSAALVGRDGSIDWFCAPRFDSPSFFGRLLDPGAGHWSIRPVGEYEVRRRYLPMTMVLETTFETGSGTLRLTDALALADGARGHEIGLESPHAIVRRLECIAGTVPVEIVFAPRPDYARAPVRVIRTEDGFAVRTQDGQIRFESDFGMETADDERSLCARIELSSGERRAFAARFLGTDGPVDRLDPAAMLADTAEGWRSWSAEHQTYSGPYREEVLAGGRLLQALTYQPTGAIVAAPTTSLPELVGGDLNWDYRFAWLRDASLTVKAQWVAACPHEAIRHFKWMAKSAGDLTGVDDRPQIMFGVDGERDLTETELDHLAGYRDSRPVRIGNGAWDQTQLDVYGEVLDAAYFLREQLDEIDMQVADFLCGLANGAARHWREPDAGIWEAREESRHYLSSKLYCWVALDRAIKLADRLGEGADVELWTTERDLLRETILERGWSEEVGAYTGAFESDRLDASVLLLSLTGFLPGDDERMRRTIETIERDLSTDDLVKRWSGAEDGAFTICSAWLAEAHALAGNPARGRAVLDALLERANDLGLLAEEVDGDGELIGNFPQGFAHIGVISAAWSIAVAEGAVPERPS